MTAQMSFTLELVSDGFPAKLLSQALAALPNDTKVVDMVRTEHAVLFRLAHPMFKEGAWITPEFHRHTAVLQGHVLYFDTFSGFYDRDFLRDGSDDVLPSETGE